MPTKLTKLRVDEGSLVDKPANPGARIVLFKRDESGETEKPAGDNAVSRLLRAIGKRLGWEDEVVKGMMAEVDEVPETFADELADRQGRKAVEEATEDVWEFTYALQDSLCSILCNPTADREALIRQSLAEFEQVVSAALPNWLAGKSAVEKVGRPIKAERLARLKAAHEQLGQIIAEAEAASDKETGAATGNGGEEENMPQVKKGALPAATMAKLPADVASYITDLEGKLGITSLAPDILDKLPDEAKSFISSLEQKVQELSGAGGEAEPADPMAALLGKADIWKGVDPRVRAVVEKAQADAEAARTALAKAQDEQKTREFVAKAAGFKALPVKPEEFGPVLKALADVKPEAFAEIERVLKAADEAISKGSLFQELGRSGGTSTGSAWGRIEAAADAIVAKGAGMTKAQAIAKVLDEQPSLYEEYLKERAR